MTTIPTCDRTYKSDLLSNWSESDALLVVGPAGAPPTYTQVLIAFDLEMRRHGDAEASFRQKWAQC
jgi:hypothetical protein